MKAVRLHAYGGTDQLRYEDVPIPEPGADEVLVKVAATSVNPIDWKRAGRRQDRNAADISRNLGTRRGWNGCENRADSGTPCPKRR